MQFLCQCCCDTADKTPSICLGQTGIMLWPNNSPPGNPTMAMAPTMGGCLWEPPGPDTCPADPGCTTPPTVRKHSNINPFAGGARNTIHHHTHQRRPCLKSALGHQPLRRNANKHRAHYRAGESSCGRWAANLQPKPHTASCDRYCRPVNNLPPFAYSRLFLTTIS